MPDDWSDGEREINRRIDLYFKNIEYKIGRRLRIDESDLCISCHGICRCLDHPWFNVKKTAPSYNWGPYR